MKSLTTLILGLGLSLPALAAPAAYFEAVLHSPALKRHLAAAGAHSEDIVTIENIDRAINPGVCKFEVKFYKDAHRSEEIQTATFQTELLGFHGPEIFVTNKTPKF